MRYKYDQQGKREKNTNSPIPLPNGVSRNLQKVGQKFSGSDNHSNSRKFSILNLLN